MNNGTPIASRALLLVLCLLLLGGCGVMPSSPPPSMATPSAQMAIPPSPTPTPAPAHQKNRYTLDIDFSPDTRRFHAKQTVYYVNRTDKPLTEIVFHVYANAFASESTAPVFNGNVKAAYPEGFSPGGCTFASITINGVAVSHETEGQTNSVLSLPLRQMLAPGQTATVAFDYTVLIPRCDTRFGHNHHVFNLANCYPIAAVIDEDGWHKDPYYAVGDPFFSEAADYDVTIRAPKDYTLASSGSLTRRSGDGDVSLWTATVQDVRDFAWFASSEFKTVSAQTGGVTVTVYTYTDTANALYALDVAVASLDFFSDTFMPYPYDTFSVVQSGFSLGGMEYPHIVQIGEGVFRNEASLANVVAHEAAHQWFYQIVGNDEVSEPWLDESLTEYATFLFLRVFDPSHDEIQRGIGRKIGAYAMDMPVYAYPDFYAYSAAVYANGLATWLALEKNIGKDAFLAMLRRYVETYAFKNASGDAFMAILGEPWAAWLKTEMKTVLPTSGGQRTAA